MTKKAKILVVDDVPANLVAMKSILRSLDIEVITAESAREALNILLEDDTFALLLLDVQMPEMDGYELASLLHEEDSTRGIPIIFLTAIDKSKEREKEGYSSGAVDFIFKPVDRFILLSKVKIFLQLHQQKQQLTHLKEEAESATKAKALFLASMSHEIRTPMNAVLGFSALLKETPLDDTQVSYLGSIENSGKMLLNIINDILDISKIESGNIELEEIVFDLPKLIEEVLKIAQASCKNKHLDFRCIYDESLPTYFKGDKTRISQVMLNLLNNAVKFTKEGSVSVHLLEINQVNDRLARLKFAIEDTGIGIAPENLEKVFQSFSQADNSTTRKFGGTGLGLSIVRHFVAMMQGAIHVESELGKGSQFIFDIVLGQASAADLPKEEESTLDPSKLKGLRVAVAEDNAANQKLIQLMLKKIGCEVDLAEDGEKMIELLQQGEFDLVLMDLQMPIMGGIECTEKLRESGCDLPIIALTADALKEEMKKCFTSGMNDFMTKPINKKRLVATLYKWGVK